jgi:hypothetical protein
MCCHAVVRGFFDLCPHGGQSPLSARIDASVGVTRRPADIMVSKF